MTGHRAGLLGAGIAALAVAGCFPLAANYVHLEAPGIRHAQAICRDIGPPVFATWQSAGVRFEVTLKPLYAAKTGEGFVRVRGRKDSNVRPAGTQGHIVRQDGASPAELRFGFERRDAVLSPNAIPIPPHGTVWHTFVFTGLPAIDFPGRLELPAMIVDGVTVPMPAFDFEVRPWAGFAPLNC
jgi:hypothetical protein